MGEKGRGFTNWMPPQCGAFSRDLQDKSQSPRYSPGVDGPWLQMTSALFVIRNVYSYLFMYKSDSFAARKCVCSDVA